MPASNAREAAVVEGLDIIPVSFLHEVVDHFNGDKIINPAEDILTPSSACEHDIDIGFFRSHGTGKCQKSR